MQKTKLTVRVDQDILNNLKQYAASNRTTLTDLIDAYLRHIPDQNPGKHTTIVSKLSGILSQDVTIEDYKQQLEEKYAR
ncbi:MAG: hypothetical protein CVU43_15140 [Chloroflexi bacterium HGW-Chloroflexi-5]|jgi:hypothetical protein|nr:MAG: hypothetical protein CVU43_15140 [Chloroflexi bacterium HGW-Chloroflexi-5]